MARLYKRGKYWYYQFLGRKYATRCTDKAAATLVSREIERRVADPTYRPPNHTTLDAALRAFVRQQTERDKAEGTLTMYERHIRHVVRVLGAGTLLSSLAAPEWDHYLSTRIAEGAKRTSIGKELSTIRGTLKRARRAGEYPFAIDEVMPQGFKIEYVPGKAHLRELEYRKLLAALRPGRRAIVAYIVATGADWQSVPMARRSDVNLRAGVVKVHGSKTAHREREVPILEPFAKDIEYAAKYMPFEPWDNVRRDLGVACKKAKVPKVTPRDLRRTCGSILRQRGVEPHLIARMLGHADARMVERIYGQLPTDKFAELMRARLNPAGTAGVQSPQVGVTTNANGSTKAAETA